MGSHGMGHGLQLVESPLHFIDPTFQGINSILTIKKNLVRLAGDVKLLLTCEYQTCAALTSTSL